MQKYKQKHLLIRKNTCFQIFSQASPFPASFLPPHPPPKAEWNFDILGVYAEPGGGRNGGKYWNYEYLDYPWVELAVFVSDNGNTKSHQKMREIRELKNTEINTQQELYIALKSKPKQSTYQIVRLSLLCWMQQSSRFYGFIEACRWYETNNHKITLNYLSRVEIDSNHNYYIPITSNYQTFPPPRVAQPPITGNHFL